MQPQGQQSLILNIYHIITATTGPVHIHVHEPWANTNFNKYNNTTGGSIEGRNVYCLVYDDFIC